MLLNNMVTAEPVEVIPVAHLVFHFGLLRLTWAYPHAATVPINLTRYNITQCPILYTFYLLAVVGLPAALQSYDHVEFLPFRLVGRGKHPAYARYIRSYRFFHKNVLPLTHGFFKMNGPESGRRGQDNHISQWDRFLISIKPNEFTIFRYIKFVGVTFRQLGVGFVQSIAERVG